MIGSSSGLFLGFSARVDKTVCLKPGEFAAFCGKPIGTGRICDNFLFHAPPCTPELFSLPSLTLTKMNYRSRTSFQFRGLFHGLLALAASTPLLCVPGQAQTDIAPAGSRTEAAVAIPGGPTRVGTSVVVAASIDTSGNAETARQALRLANEALREVPGYSPLPVSEYAPLSEALAREATKVDWGWPFTASDYQKIGKAGKVSRALTIQVSPAAGGYDATAEMYDTKRGALVGYGTGVGVGENALQSAVADAVRALGRTATLSGIVVSMPGNYTARLSLGTLAGARGGARVEYLGENGQPIAFGTIFDIAAGEAVATIAPETAYPDIFVNQRVRLVNNPVEKRALSDFSRNFEKEYSDFEKEFGLAAGIATAVYYLFVE